MRAKSSTLEAPASPRDCITGGLDGEDAPSGYEPDEVTESADDPNRAARGEHAPSCSAGATVDDLDSSDDQAARYRSRSGVVRE